MISIEENEKILGRPLKGKDKVEINCDVCNTKFVRVYTSYLQTIKKYGKYRCKKCLHADPEYKKILSNKAKELRKDPNYTKKMSKVYNSKKYKNKQSKTMKKVWGSKKYRQGRKEESAATRSAITTKLWQNKEFANKIISSINREQISKNSKEMWADRDFVEKQRLHRNSEEFRDKVSDGVKRVWQTEEYRDKLKKTRQNPEYIKNLSAKCKIFWQNPDNKKKAAEALASQPKVSSIQTILYSILGDLGVKYYREYLDKPSDPECVIGPWNFDCVIPRPGKSTLLIECQGEYWHNRDTAIKNDQSKATYINNHFADKYEIKYLWEHEFKCKDRVVETIKYWLGIANLEAIDFDLAKVEIKTCPTNEYKALLSKYHYLANAGRGGITYGAYLGEELIAVCVFSPLVRQNIKTGNYKPAECRELSRLCINPKYQKKNFASWFISKCLKILDSQYKLIISYCDTTYNHDGTTYKACNFKEDGKIRPDYWYVSKDGWVMHKKTLYNQASKMSMSEADYANKHNYTKVFGKEKLRFIYER